MQKYAGAKPTTNQRREYDMRKVWEISTRMFVFQATMFAALAVFFFKEPSALSPLILFEDAFEGAMMAIAVTTPCAYLAFIRMKGDWSFVVTMLAVMAVSYSGILFGNGLTRGGLTNSFDDTTIVILEQGILTAIFGLALLFFFHSGTKEVRRNGATEPRWAIFIAGLPLGVGTVVGGLLLRFVFNKKETVRG